MKRCRSGGPPLVLLPFALAAATLTPAPAASQPVAKASFLPEGSFDLPSSGEGALDRPRVVAWTPPDRIHVGDERGRIAVFDASGSFVRSYGEGRIERLTALAADPEGRGYALDGGRKQVLVFDERGEVAHVVGGSGQGAGSLGDPVDVALGPGGRVYVLDRGRRAVAIFSPDGIFVHEIALPAESREPRALGVGRSGLIYVADREVRAGVLRLPRLTEAFDPTSLRSVEDVDLRGADVRDPALLVCTPTGGVVAGDRDSGLLWYGDGTGARPVGTDDRLYGGSGSGRGSFRKLEDAALAGTDELVVLDGEGRKIERIRLTVEEGRPPIEPLDYPVRFQRVAPDLGGAVLAAAPGPDGGVRLAVAGAEGRNLRVVEARMVERPGAFGDRIRVPELAGEGAVRSFGDVVDRAGGAALNDTLLVVTEPRRNRFHVFDLRTGATIGAFGDNYSDDRRLSDPRGVALFPDGRIAVADRGGGRVVVFSADVATLLGAYPVPEVEGVAVSPAGRMFVRDEDGNVAGELPLAGGPLVPLPGGLSAAGVAALSVDPAGNVYALQSRSGRVAVVGSALDRIVARMGADGDLERGSHLALDPDGNVYATDLARGATVALRWGVEAPPVEGLSATWTPEGGDLAWTPVEGSFVVGYRVEGAAGADGPWSEILATGRNRARVSDPTRTRFRVSALTLTGGSGAPSAPVPVVHPAAAAAFEAGEWARAEALAAGALDALERGEAEAGEEVAATLAWWGFAAAAEAGEHRRTVAWGERLAAGLDGERAFERAARLAEAHHRLEAEAEAMRWARDALERASAAPGTASSERVAALRWTVFDAGSALGRWAEVAAVGEDLLGAAGMEPDPVLVERVARARLAVGAPDRAMSLVRTTLDGGATEETRERFTILAFMAAEALGDTAGARAFAVEVGERLPADLFVDFETAMTRLHLRADDVSQARSELLFLLGERGYAPSLARPDVAATLLTTYEELIARGDAEGARLLLDSATVALPEELGGVRRDIFGRADSVAAVADTRAKLGEGLDHFREARFRDALRFFEAAAARTDLDLDQRLIAHEIRAAVLHSLGRVAEADDAYRKVFEVDPDFELEAHAARVEAVHGVRIFSPSMLAHFKEIGPVM